MSPTPDQTPAHDLGARIHTARDKFTPLITNAPSCEDIASGVIVDIIDILGANVEDYELSPGEAQIIQHFVDDK
jgi:hypothetical protein